ncbi:hypothetical protein BC834DRAFT_935777, partial [Gloeopeniophorella convolvens]
MVIALHASVGLFLVGLFDFLLPINKTVAFAMLGLEVAFALAYCAVTFAPSISLDLPYITPLSSGVWRLSHAAKISYLELSGIIRRLGQGKVIKSRETKLRSEGLQESVLRSATQASPDIDGEALGWLLEELDEEHEVDAFISSIPGFFDSKIVEDPDRIMLGLLRPELGDTESIFGSLLTSTLESYPFGSSIPLQESDRERGMRRCLRALWY